MKNTNPPGAIDTSFFEMVVQNLSDAVLIIDQAGIIRFANPAAERLFKRPYQEIVGQNFDIPIVRGNSGILNHLGRLSPDNPPSAVELRVTEITWQAETMFLTTLRDITTWKKQENEHEAINIITSALRTATTFIEMLPIVVETTRVLLNVEDVLLVLRDPVHLSKPVEYGCGIWANDRSAQEPLQNIISQTIQNGKSSYHNQNPQPPRLAEQKVDRRALALISAPLTVENVTIGALVTGSATPLSEDEIHILEIIAMISASALRRATLHSQMERQLSRLTALHEIDLAINSTLDLRAVLNIVLDQVKAQLNVDAACILLLNRTLHVLEYAAGRGFHTSEIKFIPQSLGEGFAGQAAIQRRLISVPDLAKSELCKREKILVRHGFHAYFIVPLLAKGRIMGVLEVMQQTSMTVEQGWLDFLEAIAAQAAIAVDNATLFNELQRSTVELTIAYDSTLEGWTKAIDLRYKETDGHTLRVTELSVRLARSLNFSDEALVNFRRGAMLHDLGKVGVPDRILLKPGPLNEEEWVVMRNHPQLAYDMIASIAFLHPALDIPYCHHENWDGSGYPRGLKGLDIPLSARIFSIIDVWDALRTDRPYRPAWTEEKARQYIIDQSGKKFDPAVVEAFLHLPLSGSAEKKVTADRPSILIVDDEEYITRSLARTLGEQYRIFTANSAEAALEILAQNEIGVILADQRMPGISGVQLLERAKSVRPGLLGILISGYTDVQAVVDALNLGNVRGFLTKPWDADELRQKLQDVVGEYQALFFDYKVLRDSSRAVEQMQDQISDLRTILDAIAQVEVEDLFLQNGYQLAFITRAPIYREFLDRLPEGFALMSYEGELYFSNPKFKSLFNLGEEISSKINFLDSTFVVNNPGLHNLLTAAMGGSSGKEEITLKLADGSLCQIVMVASPQQSNHMLTQIVLAFRESPFEGILERHSTSGTLTQ